MLRKPCSPAATGSMMTGLQRFQTLKKMGGNCAVPWDSAFFATFSLFDPQLFPRLWTDALRRPLRIPNDSNGRIPHAGHAQ